MPHHPVPKRNHPVLGRKNVKPMGTYEVDRNNYFGQHAISYALLNDGRRNRYQDCARHDNWYGRLNGTQKWGTRNGEYSTLLNLPSNVSEYIVGQRPAIPASDDFTVITRVYNGNSGFVSNTIFAQYASGQSGRFVVQTRNTSGIYVFDGVTVQYITGQDTINTPQWDDFAFIRRGNEMSCVVNKSESTSNITTSVSLYTGIGTQIGGPFSHWRGYNNEFGVYDKAFTYHEIQELFKNRYQVLKPRVPVTYFIPAAVGGVANPKNPLGHPFYGMHRGPIS